jgi:hypothetical protein
MIVLKVIPPSFHLGRGAYRFQIYIAVLESEKKPAAFRENSLYYMTIGNDIQKNV